MNSECSRRCFLIRGASAAGGLILGGLGLIGCNNQSGKRVDEKMASEMIAYCGLNCSTCRIYLATRETDPEKQKEMRRGIARYMREHFDPEIRVEDITDCDGCTVKGKRLFSGCRKCQVRKCAMKKGFNNCAYCSEYPCGKLSEFFGSEDKSGAAKRRLDAIRNSLGTG